MSPAPAPLHLLLLGKAPADDGFHRCPNESRGDPLARPVALAIVDQARPVAGNVNLKLPHSRSELTQVGVATVEGFDGVV